jgi:hypothetical protein
MIRASFGYLGGFLVGTALAFEAPKDWIGSWVVFALGLGFYASAFLWERENLASITIVAGRR